MLDRVARLRAAVTRDEDGSERVRAAGARLTLAENDNRAGTLLVRRRFRAERAVAAAGVLPAAARAGGPVISVVEVRHRKPELADRADDLTRGEEPPADFVMRCCTRRREEHVHRELAVDVEPETAGHG
jgi:hypothetical protein